MGRLRWSQASLDNAANRLSDEFDSSLGCADLDGSAGMVDHPKFGTDHGHMGKPRQTLYQEPMAHMADNFSQMTFEIMITWLSL